MGKETWAEPVNDALKEKVIRLLKKGLDVDEIRRELNYKVSKQAVRSIKAHLGAYDSYGQKTVPITDADKDRIRALAGEGLDSGQIRGRLRGRYKKVQIAGVLAAMTKEALA